MSLMAPPRQPPRFVPTLTDVVEVVTPATPVVTQPAEISVTEVAAAEITTAEIAAAEEIVLDSAALEQQPSPLSIKAQPASEAHPSAVPVGLNDENVTEALRTRVMARVQANLQERLHVTLTEVIEQLQTQTVYKVLRAEIDAMVVNAVQEAVAQELERLKQRS